MSKSEVESRNIKLSDVVANSGQTRGMGVLPQLKSLGYGLFEKESVDKEPIWPMLTSSKIEDRKAAAQLIREHEPDIVEAAESQESFDQLVPIRVVVEGDKYDVVFGMTRCLARAFNHAESPKLPDTIDAIVMLQRPKDADLKFMGFAENNDRRQESPIDKAIFFKECKDDFKMTPDEIGKKVGMTGQSVRDYLKMLHPKLEAKRMDIHEGRLSLDAAKKLLAKLKQGDDGDDDAGSAPSGDRARLPSVKKLEFAYFAKQRPNWMEQKEWELFISNDVRKWIAFRLGKKYKAFAGEVVTEQPKKEKAAKKEKTKKGKVLKLAVPKTKAVKLLVALGKPEAEKWTDKQLAEKLENIVNLVEDGQKLENPDLNTFLQKLVKHYATGISITIKAPAKAAAAA